MMTRSATFSAKIRTLSEFHSRIACNQQPPSAAEILTTLRYFHQTLIRFLKEMPPVPTSAFRRFCPTLNRVTLYPNLNYSGLYYGIINLLDVFQQISASHLAIGDAILDTIKALYFFLQRDILEQLPFLLASQLGILPSELDKKLVHLISTCFIPFILIPKQECLSVPAVLMMILQHSADLSLHTLFVENLLAQKENVYRDMILVLSKGTSEARIAAANLLFHYWPIHNRHILHRKSIQYRIQAWTCVPCQNTKCVDKEPSVRCSFDPLISIKYGETAPPISLCKKCAEMVESDDKITTIPICMPMSASSNIVCQNKGCESSKRLAVGICFSEDCIRSHQYVPLRLCQECLVALHTANSKEHINHCGVKYAWGTAIERDIIEAIVKLLKETSANLEGSQTEGKRPKWLRQLEGGHTLGREIDKMADERRTLSRFGIWLLATICPPVPEARPQAIAYMMSMLLEWFATTALLPNDSIGAALEQLKTDFVLDWINLTIMNHYEIFLETLMPNPPEYAQVGGVWDRLSTKKEQMHDGLQKLFAIMPYDIITLNTWNRLIPEWMQNICDLMENDDFSEFKILLSKIFEPDLRPLPFNDEQLYQFITNHLTTGDERSISDALDWVYALSLMEISIPLSILLDAFSKCALRISQMELKQNNENGLEEEHISLHVSMIDIMSQQISLSDQSEHEVKMMAELIFSTCAIILQKPFAHCKHSCDNPELDEFLDCSACQQSVFVYQTVARLMERLSPKQQLRISVHADEQITDWKAQITNVSSKNSPVDKCTPSVIAPVSDTLAPSSSSSSPSSLIQKSATIDGVKLQFQTATIHETNVEFVGLLPSEEVETAVAHATTLTERDVGCETHHIITSSLIENVKGSLVEDTTVRESAKFWNTSVGRFRFSLSDLPPQLCLIHSILTNLEMEYEADAHYYMLTTVKFLCLHCESLLNARREHRGYLIWAQENLLIPKLWTLLRSDRSQLAELVIPLIMHCITLPCGEEIFWKVVNSQFIDQRWEERFSAVERSSVLLQLANALPVNSNKVIQTSLSCCITHLIASVDDPNVAVAQQALLSIQHMPSASLKLMCLCLEAQFDSSILDRALIITRIQQLTSIVPDEEILTWEFFIQRFEELAIEGQLLVKNGESNFIHDLTHSDPLSELYQRKVSRARQIIENSSNARSIVRTLQINSMWHQLSATTFRSSSEEMKESMHYSSHNSGNFSRLREFTDDESNMCLLMNRVVDIDNPERHIVYLTVSLFVSFLCKNKKSGDEKATAKKQSLLFRHFNALIGYSNSEKCFTISPKILRKSAVCNSFLSGLPEILDSNLVVANQIVMLGIQLLLYLPSPQKLAGDQPLAEYSLILLDNNARHFWLNSVILILYKYRYDTPPLSEYLRKLILIIICTLETEVHICNMRAPPAKIEMDPLSSSDDDDLEGDCGADKLHRPETLTVLCSQPTSVVDVNEGKLEVIEEESVADEKKQSNRTKHHFWKTTNNVIMDKRAYRCGYCNELLGNFDEETLSLCMIALETFVHREPVMAAPLLFRIISTVTRLIERPFYPWHDTPMFVAGNCRSVAKQLIRVLLHQLSSSGIFLQLFDTNIERVNQFWSTISFALADFPELNPVSVIQYLLEDILEDWPNRLSRILFNLSTYVKYVSPDAYFSHWSIVTNLLDSFFSQYLSKIQGQTDRNPIRTELKNCIGIMVAVLRLHNFSTFKNSISLVEGFSRWLTEALHECKADLLDLLAVCTACNRALLRDRDKQYLTKAIVSELVQALKFKCDMNEHNYMTVIDLILQDAGEDISEEIVDDQYNTGAYDAARPHIFDFIEFISDLHVLTEIKKITNSDSIGGDIKSSVAQIVDVEMSRSGVRDSRTVNRYLPWLTSPPSVTQSTPTAFADAVTNVRLLSWLLLGALQANQPCLPIPISCSQYMADYIHFVLAGFADQSKESVVHMSALFHAFHLCQLWTVYCERAELTSDDPQPSSLANILDFWSRVTPAILQLLSHSKVLADMVNLHFLNTMQALRQCSSAVLGQLGAMWQPILTAYHAQIPSKLRLKLDSCENQPLLNSEPLQQWLKGVRYKISQIELQTSAASPFYNV
ncbi:Cation-channel complex subunit UNC-79 family protein [Acanthocheilonema viteae]